MKDSHGRVIDYMRISLTDRCNYRCIYCMPADGVTSLCHSDILSLEEIERVVRVAATMGIKRFRLTGGEPLVRTGAVDLVRAIHETPGVDDVSLTTNGVLLPKYAEELASAGLSRVNISLDTLDPEQFRYITRRGELHEAIDRAMSELDHKLGCFSVIHMDPVDTKNERLAEMREETVQLLRSIDPVLSLHDFRMVPGKHRTNLVFDVLVPFGYKLSDEDVRKAVRAAVEERHPDCRCIIQIDKSYT